MYFNTVYCVSGMLSHQLKQFRIDGEKSIIQNPTEAQRYCNVKTVISFINEKKNIYI